MKVFNRKYRTFKKTIDIVLVTETTQSDRISASDFTPINHPKSIKKKFKLSGTQLQIFNNGIESIRNTVASNGFTVANDRDSKKSYAHYFDGIAYKDTSEGRFRFVITFRITEHNNKNFTDHSVLEPDPNVATIATIKQIIIENVSFNSFAKAGAYVSKICKSFLDDEIDEVMNPEIARFNEVDKNESEF